MRSATAEATEVVVLRGGLSVPLTALKLAWALEDKGVTLGIDADDALVAQPKGLLTTEDRTAIGRWTSDLRAIVRYAAPEAQ